MARYTLALLAAPKRLARSVVILSVQLPAIQSDQTVRFELVPFSAQLQFLPAILPA